MYTCVFVLQIQLGSEMRCVTCVCVSDLFWDGRRMLGAKEELGVCRLWTLCVTLKSGPWVVYL